MEKRYYTSTNWAPWLGLGFLLSSIFLGFVSNGWLSAFLVFLSFLPAIVVALTLRGYFLIENNQIKFCYDRKKGRQTNFAISIVDVTHVQRIGRSVAITFDTDEEVTKRVYEADKFVEEIMQRNPRIK
jgi:hypothetical protein